MKKKRTSSPKIIAQRYRVERELGRGGAGVVYLVRDIEQKDRALALKVVGAKETDFSLLSDFLKNEFETLTLLRHQNLARVFDFGMTGQEIYFSSEWVDGKDILTVCRAANLNTVFQLIVQVLRAVDFLHRRGVLHLDLKPANILVTDPDRTGELSVKLIDFGIAEWKRRGHLNLGEFSGTPPYAPPEVMMQKGASPASDIYSVGMILHQIFAKRFPFRSEEVFQMMQEQMYKDPLRLEALNPALPEDFPDLLLKMVARDPAERFQTPREVIEAINKTLGENFTLRSPSAPIKILEESDHLFRPELFEELIKIFSEKDPPLVSLKGPEGIGKRHLMRRVKETLQLRGIATRWSLNNRGGEDPTVQTTSKEEIRELELLPLTSSQITEFLKTEIIESPVSSLAEELTSLSGGFPTMLEVILQALREEGTIQWSDQGWSWKKEAEIPMADLLPKQETRWKERRQRVQELLKFSRSELTAKILEGILHLEAGALSEQLAAWEKSGLILKKESEGAPLYFIPAPSGPKPRRFHQDWTWAEQELKRLYDTDQFESGAELARLISTQVKDPKEIPDAVALVSARHLASAGEPTESLKALPLKAPPTSHEKGLFHEIRARDYLRLGRFEEAQEELRQAEDGYQSTGDLMDMAALLNLKGRVLKEKGELEAAEAAFLSAAAKAEEAKDDYILALIEMNLGTLHHQLGLFERAYSAYEQALSLSSLVDHPLLSCTVRHNAVNLLYYMGRTADAEKACYDWLQLSIRHHFPEQQALSLNYMGLLAGQRGHSEQQLAYLNQAVGLLTSRGFENRLAQFLINRSYVYFELQKFIPAQLDAEAALELALKRSMRSLSSLAFLSLGKILRDRPKANLSESQALLEKALKIAEEVKVRQILWEVNFERGILAKAQKEFERAKGYFLESQRHLESLLAEMPEDHKKSYLRDRKLEKIEGELEALEKKAT